MVAENKSSLPPLSSEDQEKLDRLQKDRRKAKHPLVVVWISAAFVGVMALIYAWYAFHWTGWLLFLLILIGILLLILLIRAGYAAQWTGFSGKTTWDWLQLLSGLAIPIVVLSATLVFSTQQDKANIAQHDNDLKIADNQQQEATLKAYLDDMTTLLLDKKLGSQAVADKVASDEAAVIARAKTLTALSRLDPRRKGVLLRFLYEAKLIGATIETSTQVKGQLVTKTMKFPQIIDMTDADLNGVILTFVNLNGIDLHLAWLQDAELSFDGLVGADLSDARMAGAKLNLSRLGNANLQSAFLKNADLSGAIFTNADLSGATLTNADLSECGQYSVSKSGDDLSGAMLTGATLDGADLHKAIVTKAQLMEAKSYNGAILPDAESHTCPNMTYSPI